MIRFIRTQYLFPNRISQWISHRNFAEEDGGQLLFNVDESNGKELVFVDVEKEAVTLICGEQPLTKRTVVAYIPKKHMTALSSAKVTTTASMLFFFTNLPRFLLPCSTLFYTYVLS